MAWLFHVVEIADGRWAGRHGNEIDDHSGSAEAIEHCLGLAAAVKPAAVIVHRPGQPMQRIDIPHEVTPHSVYPTDAARSRANSRLAPRRVAFGLTLMTRRAAANGLSSNP